MADKDMEMNMKEANSMLDMEPKDNSSSKNDDNSSILHFCGAVWDMYGLMSTTSL